jgi:hypothetical protein
MESTTSYWKFALLVVSITSLRSGVRIASNLETYLEESLSFPNMTSFFKSSLVMPLITKALSIDTTNYWILVYGLIVLSFISVLLIGIRTAKHQLNKKLIITLFFFSQLQVIVFTEIGKFDLFLIMGATCLILFDGNTVKLVGALLMTMGNFEQAIAAFFVLIIYSLSSDNDLKTRRMLSITSIAVVVQFCFLNIAYGKWSFNGGDSRYNWLAENGVRYFKSNISSLPTLLYSGYGIIWILVIITILRSSSILNLSLHFICLVMIPFVLTMTTFDGTRVWVIITAPLTLHLIRIFSAEKAEIFGRKIFVSIVFLIGMLTPALNVEVMGSVKKPYLHLFDTFKSNQNL